MDPSYVKAGNLGMGASWLRWELTERLGVQPVGPAEADVVLASVQSQQEFGALRTSLRKNRVDPRRTPVIIGGPGAYAPAVFGTDISAACVGEGRGFLRALVCDGLEAAKALPNAWVPGETREVIPDGDFPWDCPPIRYQDGTTRLFASRGCRRKCAFCQTGWESTYRRNPDMEGLYRQAAVLAGRGETVFCTSNDQSELDWRRLPPLPHMSATVVGLRKFISQPEIISRVRSIRVGVEGISERLRRAVRKPISWDELISTTITVLALGRTFRWFMIVGLPGEDDRDYEEFRTAILEVKRHCRKGAVMIHFHAFLPHPAAPLSIFPLADGYWPRFDEFRRWFFDGPGLTRRVQIVACAQEKTRMQQARRNMAATDDELRRGWWGHENPNWRVRYVGTVAGRRRAAQRYGRELGMATEFPEG